MIFHELQSTIIYALIYLFFIYLLSSTASTFLLLSSTFIHSLLYHFYNRLLLSTIFRHHEFPSTTIYVHLPSSTPTYNLLPSSAMFTLLYKRLPYQNYRLSKLSSTSTNCYLTLLYFFHSLLHSPTLLFKSLMM